MERDFETVMIEQCAPVLAGLKPAGLFRYETRDRADLARRVAGWNAQLNPNGLQVRVLRGCIATRQYLVYVYRAAKLQAVRQMPPCAAFRRGGLPSAGRCRGLQRAAGPAQPAAVLRGRGGGFPPRDRGISGLSAGGCDGLYPPSGQVLYLLRMLEVWRPAAASNTDQLQVHGSRHLQLFHSGTPILKLAVAA